MGQAGLVLASWPCWPCWPCWLTRVAWPGLDGHGGATSCRRHSVRFNAYSLACNAGSGSGRCAQMLTSSSNPPTTGNLLAALPPCCCCLSLAGLPAPPSASWRGISAVCYSHTYVLPYLYTCHRYPALVHVCAMYLYTHTCPGTCTCTRSTYSCADMYLSK